MNNGKKIVYVLGAGASLGAGACAYVQGGGKVKIPTQADFWKTYLRFAKDSARKKNIINFLFRYFLGYSKSPSKNKKIDPKKLQGIDVEEAFTFLSERIRAPSTSQQLRQYSEKVWLDLVIETGNVFRKFKANKETRRIYKLLQKNQLELRDAVVSFNYDTIFENSLKCGNDFGWHYTGLDVHESKSLMILKPHGSINWYLNSKSKKIQRSKNPEICAVVAPSHLKFVSKAASEVDAKKETTSDGAGYLDQSDQFNAIWSKLEHCMKKADVIVFIGYSFPVADLYFSSVLRSVLATRSTNPGIVIVNPDAIAITARLKQRFSLEKIIPYFDLEQFANISRARLIDSIRN